MKEGSQSPTDTNRFKVPDGYSELEPNGQYRFFLDVQFPEVRPELLISIPASPSKLPDAAWTAVRQTVEQWLKDSIRYEVVAVKDSAGKIVLEGEFSEILELRRQELLEHLGFEEL